MRATTADISKVEIFFIVILPWAPSACAAYIMAMFSIGSAIANILLLVSVLCLLLALMLISKQKTFTALMVAVAPAPAIAGFAVAATYIASFLNGAV